MSKSKRKTQNLSSERLLNKCQIELIKARDPLLQFSIIRNNVPKHLYSRLLALVMKMESKAKQIFSDPFPKEVSRWMTVLPPSYIGIESELYWSYCYIQYYQAQLCDYVHLQTLYHESFMRNEYTKCREVLCEIQKIYGYSIWLLKKQIIIAQQIDGLEGQKKLAEEIQNNKDFKHEIIPYLSYYLSYRTENYNSSLRFERDFIVHLEKNKQPEWFDGYIKHHVIPNTFNKVEQLIRVVHFDSSSSLIDMYEAFIYTIQIIALTNCNGLFELVKPMCDHFVERFYEKRLVNIRFDNGCDLTYDFIATEQKLYSKFVEEKYDELINIDCSNKENKNLYTSLIKIFARAYIVNKEIENLDKWEKPIIDLLTSERPKEEAKSEILRLAWEVDDFSFSLICKIALYWLYNESIFVNDILEDRNIHNVIGVSPLNLSFISPDIEVKIIEESSMVYTNSLYYKTVKAKKYFLENDFLNSLELGTIIYQSDKLFFKRFAVRLIAYSFLKLLKFDELFDFIADLYIVNSYYINILPVQEILKMQSVMEDKKLRKKMSFVVFQYACRNIYANDDNRQCKYSLEDFLLYNNVNRPSEISLSQVSEKKAYVVFFLENICVENFIDSLVTLESSKDVANERIEICKKLIVLNPSQIENYQDEIKSIIQRLEMKSRLKQIDESKIYVDIFNIKNKEIEELSQSYTRYLNLLNNGLQNKSLSDDHNVGSIEVIISDEKQISVTYPKNELYSILQDIVLCIRDDFVSSTQYGLNGYLSVRIRHGKLEGQVYAAFEAENLLIPQNILENKYPYNFFWIDKLKVDNVGEQENIVKCFSTFTLKIEQLIDTINSKWLQIKKLSSDEGLFDFVITNSDILLLSTSIKNNLPFEKFIDIVIDRLTHHNIQSSLDNIRNRLQIDVKKQIFELLTELQISVESVLPLKNVSELRSAISRARTQVQTNLDRIIEWFHLPRESKKEPFLINDAVNISVLSIQRIASSFDYQLNIQDDLQGVQIQGNLTCFVDLLFIVFDNIVKHSGVPNKQIAIVDVNADEKYINIKVVNEISEHACTEEKRIKVKQILTQINANSYISSITREGGSGFFKLYKILHYDLGNSDDESKGRLQFGFMDKTFFVEFGIPIKQVFISGGENEDAAC